MQGHLFESSTVVGIERALRVPVAAKSDPGTSHEAAQAITRSGRREGQLMGVLALIKKHPLSTSLELSRYGFDRYVTARRLPELAKAGLVMRRKVRECTVGKRPATTWEAVT